MVSSLLILKDYNKRVLFDKKYTKSLVNKTILNNFFYKKNVYYSILFFAFSYIHYTKIKNFCVLSYRRRGIFNHFKLTRMMFKYYALNKQLNGLMKSSW